MTWTGHPSRLGVGGGTSPALVEGGVVCLLQTSQEEPGLPASLRKACGSSDALVAVLERCRQGACSVGAFPVEFSQPVPAGALIRPILQMTEMVPQSHN